MRAFYNSDYGNTLFGPDASSWPQCAASTVGGTQNLPSDGWGTLLRVGVHRPLDLFYAWNSGELYVQLNKGGWVLLPTAAELASKVGIFRPPITPEVEVDFDNLPSGFLHAVGDFNHAPHGFFNGEVETHRYSLASNQRTRDYNTGEMYERAQAAGIWSEWVHVGTATRPEEHALPLMEGWTAGRSRTKFSIFQNSLVLVTFGVLGPANTSDRAVIAQLPPGFRPGELISTQCIVTEPQTYTRYPAGLDIDPAGNVIVFSKQPGWTIAVGQAFFYANA